MNPNLITAVADRIAAGHTEETIIAELLATGYTPELAAAAYRTARGTGNVAAVEEPVHDTVKSTQTVNLISFFRLTQQSWQLFINNISLFGAATLSVCPVFGILIAIAYAETVTSATLFSSSSGMVIYNFTLTLVSTVFFAISTISLAQALLKRENGTKFWVTYFALLPQFWRILILSIMLQLVISGGLLLLIIPGIVLMVYLLFPLTVFADSGVDGMRAMYQSYRLVKGRWWSVCGRLLVSLIAVVCVSVIFPASMFLLLVLMYLVGLASSEFTSFFSAVAPFLLGIGLLGYLFVLVSWLSSVLIILYESLKQTSALPQTDPSTNFSAAMIFFMTLGVVMYGLQFLGLI